MEVIHNDPGKLGVFAQCVSYFDERVHEALLLQLLGISLWVCSNEVMDAVLDFTINLVSANSGCLHLCLDMLVRNFLPPSSGIPTFMGVSRRGQPAGMAAIAKARERKGEEISRKPEVLKRVQATLGRIAQLVPTAHMRLLPIVLHKMPHKRVEKEVRQCIKGPFPPMLQSVSEHRVSALPYFQEG
eukprot:jgi/Mesen1/10760/ME000909S10082